MPLATSEARRSSIGPEHSLNATGGGIIRLRDHVGEDMRPLPDAFLGPAAPSPR